MAMLLCFDTVLWSIIGDAGLFVSSIVPSAPPPLSFHISTGNMGSRPHAYAYLHKRRGWMRYQAYRQQHLPIGSGITEAACKVVFTQRLKRSGMSWTIVGGQVILDLRVIWLSGVWDDVHQRYLASKPLPATQVDIAKGAQCGQRVA
jgi:hypothetical protein